MDARDAAARAQRNGSVASFSATERERERTFFLLFARDGFLIHRPDSFDGSLAGAESSISRGKGRRPSSSFPPLRHALNSAAQVLLIFCFASPAASEA